MPTEDREKYYEFNNENEKLVKKIQTLQTDIKKSKDMTRVHMDSISKSKVCNGFFFQISFIVNMFGPRQLPGVLYNFSEQTKETRTYEKYETVRKTKT